VSFFGFFFEDEIFLNTSRIWARVHRFFHRRMLKIYVQIVLVRTSGSKFELVGQKISFIFRWMTRLCSETASCGLPDFCRSRQTVLVRTSGSKFKLVGQKISFIFRWMTRLCSETASCGLPDFCRSRQTALISICQLPAS
jgi:hypothetical protein